MSNAMSYLVYFKMKYNQLSSVHLCLPKKKRVGKKRNDSKIGSGL